MRSIIEVFLRKELLLKVSRANGLSVDDIKNIVCLVQDDVDHVYAKVNGTISHHVTMGLKYVILHKASIFKD